MAKRTETPPVRDEGRDQPSRPLVPVVSRLAAGPVDARVSVLEVYETEHLDLFRYLRATVRDPLVAEDLLQDAFLRLVRECASGHPPTDPRAWLYRVATNLAISGARRTRSATRTLQAIHPDELDARSPESVALEVERDEELRTALAGIAPEARAALVLASHGFSAREIGAAVGRSEAAVRTLICRARLRLRDRMSVVADGPTDRHGAAG
jgi:RNA polymerase sigma-70 factor (ECF subfamily)